MDICNESEDADPTSNDDDDTLSDGNVEDDHEEVLNPIVGVSERIFGTLSKFQTILSNFLHIMQTSFLNYEFRVYNLAQLRFDCETHQRQWEI